MVAHGDKKVVELNDEKEVEARLVGVVVSSSELLLSLCDLRVYCGF